MWKKIKLGIVWLAVGDLWLGHDKACTWQHVKHAGKTAPELVMHSAMADALLQESRTGLMQTGALQVNQNSPLIGMHWAQQSTRLCPFQPCLEPHRPHMDLHGSSRAQPRLHACSCLHARHRSSTCTTHWGCLRIRHHEPTLRTHFGLLWGRSRSVFVYLILFIFLRLRLMSNQPVCGASCLDAEE